MTLFSESKAMWELKQSPNQTLEFVLQVREQLSIPCVLYLLDGI